MNDMNRQSTEESRAAALARHNAIQHEKDKPKRIAEVAAITAVGAAALGTMIYGGIDFLQDSKQFYTCMHTEGFKLADLFKNFFTVIRTCGR